MSVKWGGMRNKSELEAAPSSLGMQDGNNYDRPESPTLPLEHINGLTRKNEANHTYSSPSVNNNLSSLRGNSMTPPRSPFEAPASPASPAFYSQEQNRSQNNGANRQPSPRPRLDKGGSNSTVLMKTSSSSSSVSSQYRSSSNNSSSRSKGHKSSQHHNNKISDNLAAAIELSINKGPTSVAPAAGMYWSRVLTQGRGPSKPLRAHTANLVGEKLYVFGGCDVSSCFSTLYILDMDSMIWSSPRTNEQNRPPPCRAHSCTVVERDNNGKKSHYLYIFGGGNGPDYFQDVYILDTETLVWYKPNIDLKSRPSKRRAHTSCLWDDKLIVIGGGDGARALDDVYTLDLANYNPTLIGNVSKDVLKWEKLQTVGIPPPARGYHTSNLVKDKLVVFGGSDGHDCFEDVYVLDLKTAKWSPIELEHRIPRLAHTSTQVGSYVFVIGGHDGRRYSQEVLLFNLVTMSWEVRRVYGTPPNPRGYHTTVLYDSRLYVLGGYDGKNVFDDVHMLELSACAYLPQITNFEIDV